MHVCAVCWFMSVCVHVWVCLFVRAYMWALVCLLSILRFSKHKSHAVCNNYFVNWLLTLRQLLKQFTHSVSSAGNKTQHPGSDRWVHSPHSAGEVTLELDWEIHHRVINSKAVGFPGVVQHLQPRHRAPSFTWLLHNPDWARDSVNTYYSCSISPWLSLSRAKVTSISVIFSSLKYVSVDQYGTWIQTEASQWLQTSLHCPFRRSIYSIQPSSYHIPNPSHSHLGAI